MAGVLFLTATPSFVLIWAGDDMTGVPPKPNVATAGRTLEEGPTYYGMCDASAAVAVGREFFLAANDEDNVLRLYRRDRGGMPVATFDISSFLRPAEPGREADIEAVAALGDRVYWITSHGRNREGKLRPTRYRFFATQIDRTGGKIEVHGVGRPYRGLLDDLLADRRLRRYRLAPASQRAPKSAGALNIEGLAAAPHGRLLIGFRNPIPKGKAILVPLENPAEVIDGERAKLGDPIELDLDGLGVRSLQYHPVRREYLIIAGAYFAHGRFRLYSWSGKRDNRPQELGKIDFGSLSPEAIVLYGDERADRIHILSDDGVRRIDDCDCKRLEDVRKRRFRSAWLRLPESSAP